MKLFLAILAIFAVFSTGFAAPAGGDLSDVLTNVASVFEPLFAQLGLDHLRVKPILKSIPVTVPSGLPSLPGVTVPSVSVPTLP